MDVIGEFMARYAKEIDFYDQVARIAAREIEALIRAAGIRAIVTSRAKDPTRLEEKVRQRDKAKNYSSVDQIYDDIVDLAGVRIALYFPGERDKIGAIVARLFDEFDDAREFPRDSDALPDKRFSGYSATHYRVRFRGSALKESEQRYTSAGIEIQVASVLMHAWSEVEHDLVYKPYAGALSDAEYALLDQLNGLVLSGEIALEQLQRAGESRIAEHDRAFGNHYELAAHLVGSSNSVINESEIGDEGMGRVDLLFAFLRSLEIATPKQIQPYIESIHPDLEQRPLADQVIDALLREDPERYRTYDRVRADLDYGQRGRTPSDPTKTQAIGSFISEWIELERLLRNAVGVESGSRLLSQSKLRNLLPGDLRFEYDFLRRMRNELVHGEAVPPSDILEESAERLGALITRVRMHLEE